MSQIVAHEKPREDYIGASFNYNSLEKLPDWQLASLHSLSRAKLLLIEGYNFIIKI